MPRIQTCSRIRKNSDDQSDDPKSCDFGYKRGRTPPRKPCPGKPPVQRDQPFRHIAQQREDFRRSGAPRIRADPRKKALLGSFKHDGQTWCHAGEQVNAHDLPPDAVGRAAPSGVDDPERHEGHVCVTTSSDTAPLTQFGRAMRELGVELIPAHRPQAKGRAERRHGIFQDRFVKALRLQQIHTRESANAFVEHESLEEMNEPFPVTARAPANLHRPLPRGLNRNQVRCHPEPRVVRNDGTVSWCNRICQWRVVHHKLSPARQNILVSELLDGTLRLTFGSHTLS